jgi:hypothetical protein
MTQSQANRSQPMTENTDAKIRHVYDRWHETIVRKDVDGLIALYAEDAIFETPAILVTLADRTQGFCGERARSGRFSRRDFASLETNSVAGTAPAEIWPAGRDDDYRGRRTRPGRPSRDTRGKVSDEDLADVRAAGFTDADIVAIAGLTAQFLLTNFMSNIAQVELDFPQAELPASRLNNSSAPARH